MACMCTYIYAGLWHTSWNPKLRLIDGKHYQFINDRPGQLSPIHPIRTQSHSAFQHKDCRTTPHIHPTAYAPPYTHPTSPCSQSHPYPHYQSVTCSYLTISTSHLRCPKPHQSHVPFNTSHTLTASCPPNSTPNIMPLWHTPQIHLPPCSMPQNSHTPHSQWPGHTTISPPATSCTPVLVNLAIHAQQMKVNNGMNEPSPKFCPCRPTPNCTSQLPYHISSRNHQHSNSDHSPTKYTAAGQIPHGLFYVLCTVAVTFQPICLWCHISYDPKRYICTYIALFSMFQQQTRYTICA